MKQQDNPVSQSPGNTPKSNLLYVVGFCLAASALFRTMFAPCPPGYSPIFIHISMGSFLVLMLIEPWISGRFRWFPSLYMVVQSTLPITYVLITPKETISILYISLTIQAYSFFQGQVRINWAILLSAIVVGIQVHLFGFPMGLPPAGIYLSAIFFVASYSILLDREEENSRHNQSLLRELQSAHTQLKAYAKEVGELAAAEERGRLARELHDSVSQNLFGMTLLTKTMLLTSKEPNTKQTAQLQELESLAKDTLAEMRYLIFQLRPAPPHEKGLVPALQQHIENIQRHYPIQVKLAVEGNPQLTDEQAHKLFRIAQEALNNVIKYAKVSNASLAVEESPDQIALSIEDQGIGFDQESPPTGTMGLHNMQERAEAMGASFSLRSAIGSGTKIEVRLPKHDNHHLYT